MKAAKIAYREKVELQFQSDNMREAWKGIQTLIGETKTKACSEGLSQEERKDHCVQLNTLYCRFDENHNFTVEISDIKAELFDQTSEEEALEVIEESTVRTLLMVCAEDCGTSVVRSSLVFSVSSLRGLCNCVKFPHYGKPQQSVSFQKSANSHRLMTIVPLLSPP